jgi:hypothetical protein
VSGKHSWPVVCASLFAGLFGGIASTWLSPARLVLAQKATPTGFLKVLRVERLELVDKQANVRGVLEVLPSGTPRLLLGDISKSVWINDEALSIGDLRAGGRGVMVGSTPTDGIGVKVFDVSSGAVTIRADGVGVTDKWDDTRIALLNRPDGPGLTLYDRGGGKPRVVLAVPGGFGIGSLMVLGADNSVLWAAP